VFCGDLCVCLYAYQQHHMKALQQLPCCQTCCWHIYGPHELWRERFLIVKFPSASNKVKFIPFQVQKKSSAPFVFLIIYWAFHSQSHVNKTIRNGL
jgi:hypothetical protein